LVFAFLFAAGCASSASASEDRQTASGRTLAETHCAICHAIGRFGSSRHPDAPALRTLSRMNPVSTLEESLVEGIMVGHPDMPEFRFQPTDAAALIFYLESIQEPEIR
jgi:cytochrome c